MAPPFNLLVILGPTASGKTRLGVQAARVLEGEVISADSRQVYRGMDLGSGKDLAEYGEVPYHLIDIADPGEEFSVFRFQRSFFEVFADIARRGRLPLLVGGTGLYLDAALRGYRMVEIPANPSLRSELEPLPMEVLVERLRRSRIQLHNLTDVTDRNRLIRAIEIAEGSPVADSQLPPAPVLRPLVFGLRWERKELRRRIAVRLRERLDQGLLEEVAGLHRAGYSWERLEYFGLEYRYVAWHLQGRINRNDLVQKLASAIGDLAKRQETWFRRMERQGVDIHWLEGAGEPLSALLAAIEAVP